MNTSSKRFRGRLLSVAGSLLTIASSLAQPRLEIHRSSGTAHEFRWPGAATGFSLEVAHTLATPTGWQAVTQAPVLLNGMYSVTIPMEAGTRFFRLRSTVIPLTTIASSLPANRETGVAVTRATSIRFSGLLYDENPLSEEKIYAEYNGVRLPAIAELVDDGLPVTTVRLSYLTDLPAAARIRVTVNGSLLHDDRDRLVDADGNGSPGGVRVLEFETADNRPPDSDGDGIDDPTETTLGTDPARWDTDGDGFSDGREREAGTDALAVDSRPGIRLAEAPGTVGELMATFPSYGPFAVGPDSIAANGQVTTRIEAMLNPQSTPAIVNQALDAAGLRIVTLRPGLLFVTLALAPRPGAAYTATKVAVVAQQLIAENSDMKPFLLADPAFAPRPKLYPGAPDSEAAGALRPQDQVRLPAAWNLLAKPPPAPARPVRVLVPDFYSWTTRHPQIWIQRFVPSLGWTTPGATGNHGFAVASAVAANFDDLLPTGGYPTASERPTDYLEVLSLPIDGLSARDMDLVIVDAIKLHQPDIVSTSVGYVADVPTISTRIQRIMGAYYWRQLVLNCGQPFLHISAAGNDFDDPRTLPGYEKLAEFDAEWNLAGRRGNLEDMLQGATELTPAEIARLERAVWALPASLPGLFEPLNNVVIVGSMETNGSRSVFSEFGEDVLAQGSDLTLACAPAHAGDNCVRSGLSGTSYAAPQVAGVAAYLLTQKPGLSPTQLRDALLNTRAGDLLDAYRAVLELDAGDDQRPLRRRLLDVAGGEETDASGAQPDGKFDEKDIAAFLSAFKDAEALWEPGDPRDHSRFDLNGDGYTGGPGRVSFDLDAEDGLGAVVAYIGGGALDLEEAAVTDREILCYFANSSLYEGSKAERALLLGSECPLPPMLAFRFQGPTDNGIQIVTAKSGTVAYGVRDPNNVISFGVPVWSPSGSELAFSEREAIRIIRVGGVLAEESPFAVLIPSPAGSASYAAPVYFERAAPGGDLMYLQRLFAGASQTWVSKVPPVGLSRQLTTFGVGEGVRFPYGLGSQQGTVSPGNEWAFTYDPGNGGKKSLRTITPDGLQQDLTPSMDVGTVTAYWAPGGNSLAFASGDKVQLLSKTTLEVRTLATGAWGYRVSWSPDGRYLAYIYRPQGAAEMELRAVDLEGGPTLQLGTGTTLTDPAWSPDGKEISFVRNFDVWVRTMATGAERRLTFTPESDEQGLVWRPGSTTAP